MISNGVLKQKITPVDSFSKSPNQCLVALVVNVIYGLPTLQIVVGGKSERKVNLLDSFPGCLY